jgi:tetratricopeptide (TPR) repeat protein
MPAVRFVLAGCLLAAACGVRTPAPIDVAALVSARGAVEARRDLMVRVLDDPRDVQARLALATLAEQAGRPSEAIEQLDAVERLGGPLGTRWHEADRARLGRLLLARGRVRLARGAPTALADLERAATFGASATTDELARARLAIAIAQLRHSDADERTKGRAFIASLRPDAAAQMPRGIAATMSRDGTAPPRDGTAPPRDGTAPPGEEAAALLAGRSAPHDIAGGATPDAAAALRGLYGAWAWNQGARREGYEQLAAWHAATKPPRDEELQGAYLRALAWWSPVWLGEARVPPAADLVGPERCWFPGADCAPPVETPSPLPPVQELGADPRVAAAARYAATRMQSDVTALVPIARAHMRDGSIAERLGRDYVASATDAALANATLGALFDALGDPARARAAWHAAVESSAEPGFVRGLAEAAARAGDAAAALVFATQAAAAWGDPAAVWAGVARALVTTGQSVDALTAARSAIDLAGPDVLPHALDLAIAASKALGRQAQVDALVARRARLAALLPREDAEVQAVLAAHREQPTASTIASLWVASRDAARDVEIRAALAAALDGDDPRRATIVAELVALAGDPDSERALDAVSALRR